MDSQEEEQWLTTQDVSARLGLCTARVRQLLATGRIPSIRTPLGRLVLPEDVEAEAKRRKGRSTRGQPTIME